MHEALKLIEWLCKQTENQRFYLVLSSRYNPQKTNEKTNQQTLPGFPQMSFESAIIQPFSREKVTSIIGRDSPEIFNLIETLRNTMFMSMYLHLQKNGVADGLNNMQKPGQFLRYYFRTLVRIKNVDRYTDDKSIDDKLIAIGERIEQQSKGEPTPTRVSDVPLAYTRIFDEIKDEAGNYIIETPHMKYKMFCLGMYWKEAILQGKSVQSVLDSTVDGCQNALYLIHDTLTDAEYDIFLNIYKKMPYNNTQRNTPENFVVKMMMDIVCGENGSEAILPDDATTIWTHMFGTYETFLPDPPEPSNPISWLFGAIGNPNVSVISTWNMSLETVFLPNIITVCRSAFHSCHAIKNVDLPRTEHIDGWAFAFCYNLQTIHIPIVKYIGDWAFDKCEKLHTVIAPKVEIIRECAFSSNKELNSLDIPSAVEIKFLAFSNCTNLETIYLSNIRTIEARAFEGCTNLKQIIYSGTAEEWARVKKERDFDDGILEYEIRCSDKTLYRKADVFQKWIYSGKTILEDEDLPNITKIPASAFSKRDNPEEIHLSKITHVGKEAFATLSDLKLIDMPCVDTIEESAFAGISKLSDIRLPKVRRIGESAFSKCPKLEVVELPHAYYIENRAFALCSNLTEIRIPGILEIGREAFDQCTALKKIYYGKTKQEWAKVKKGGNWDGGLVNCMIICKDGEIHFKDCIVSLSISNLPDVTEIQANAYCNKTMLADVELPKIKRIGECAFKNCRSLKKAWFSNAKRIQADAFANCSSLQSVSIPSVEFLGDRTFQDCTELSEIVLPRVQTIGHETFQGCKKLKKVTLPCITRICAHAFADCILLTDIYCPNLTKKEWKALPKEDGWDEGTPEYTVHCFNADVRKARSKKSCLLNPKK